jgi:hypothetical protein
MSLSPLGFVRYRDVTDGRTEGIAVAITRLQHSVLAARKNQGLLICCIQTSHHWHGLSAAGFLTKAVFSVYVLCPVYSYEM